MRSRTIAAATIGAALLGGTAQAQASTLAVDANCYLSGSPVGATGTGFTAGGPVNFTFDGQLAATGTGDGGGNFTQPLTAPALTGNTHQHAYSLAAQDQTNPALAATVQVNVTDRVATVSPRRARPARKVKFGIHALNPGQAVYLHYVFHRKQRYVKRLGVAKAPCGSLTVRKRFFPVNRPKFGTWTFQFDNKQKYSKTTQPQISGPVQIYRIFR